MKMLIFCFLFSTIIFDAKAFASPTEIFTSIKYVYKSGSSEFDSEIGKIRLIYERHLENDLNISSAKSLCEIDGRQEISAAIEAQFGNAVELSREYEMSSSPIKNFAFYFSGLNSPSASTLNVKCYFRGRFKNNHNTKVSAEYSLSIAISISDVTKNEGVLIRIRG